jgi:hypothetical protein
VAMPAMCDFELDIKRFAVTEKEVIHS